MLSKASKSSILISIGLLYLVTSFQNCSGFRPMDADSNMLSSLVDDCNESSPGYNACIINKNGYSKTAQESSSIIPIKFEDSDLSKSGTDSKEQISVLANSFVDVSPATGTEYRAKPDSSGNWFYSFNSKELPQVTAFYYINNFSKKLSSLLGPEYLENYFPKVSENPAPIKVITNSSFAGWSFALKEDASVLYQEIHLALNPKVGNMAYDASMILYFWGIANLHYATNGRTFSPDVNNYSAACFDFNHNLLPYGCCNNKLGCSKAIESAIGDYYASMAFENDPIIGESWAKKTEGFSSCEVTRNPDANIKLTNEIAFNACGNDAKGEIHVMGSVYHAIWWKLRKEFWDDRNNVDKLFLLHMKEINKDDKDFNFFDALNEAYAIDSSIFGGKFSPTLKSIAAEHGI